MIINNPVSFEEALEARKVKTILPTELRTFLLSILPASLRRRAMFSAGVTNVELLDQWDGLIGEMLEGQIDQATARLRMKEKLTAMGYVPPKGSEGGLIDLSSDARINIILDTNTAQARGYGQWAQDQDPDILDLWPAQELFRAIESRIQRDWRGRWINNGGQFFNGRMIARKDDPIWFNISRFGNPFPPFDFNSGMRTRNIEREEAEKLGLMSVDESAPQPQTLDINQSLRASPKIRSKALRAELEATGVGAFDDEGVFRLTPQPGQQS